MASKIITVYFTNNSVPQTGLTPTIDIYMLDPIIPTNNTLVVTNGPTTEIGMGWYRYDFTTYNPAKTYVFNFDGGASLPECDRYKYGGNESYEEDISYEVWEEPAVDHTMSGSTGMLLNQINANTTTIIVDLGTITTIVNTLLQIETGKTVIDPTAMTLTIYGSDCITPLIVFNLRDSNGNPSVSEVCQRVPTPECP